jgi:hypothetical protein
LKIIERNYFAPENKRKEEVTEDGDGPSPGAGVQYCYLLSAASPTIAELQLYHELDGLDIFHLLPSELNYPKITAWLKKINEREASKTIVI